MIEFRTLTDDYPDGGTVLAAQLIRAEPHLLTGAYPRAGWIEPGAGPSATALRVC
jgi:hypothetical protein